MKPTFTLLFLLLLCLGTHAQTILFEEKFDEMTPYTIMGWPYEFSGVVPWQCGLPFQVGPCMPPTYGAMSENIGTNKVACFCECGAVDFDDHSVLTSTPSINLSADTGAWLKYDSYFIGYSNSLGQTEQATVEVSTDDGTTWTVVENVAPSVPYGRFNTHYVKLSAYNHASDIRIGFRYNDDGGHMKGWAIDNVMVFIPAHKDIAIKSVTPADSLLSYVAVGSGVNHQVTIYNAGLDTAHSFTLTYSQDGGPLHSTTISGVNIPAFTTATFTHAIPDSVWTMGRHTIQMWASLAGDTIRRNDTGVCYLYGASFIPSKRLAIESGEGTYNGWSPRNMYYMHSVLPLDVTATLISIHEADPMVDTVYHDFMFNLDWNYVPYILFDRRQKVQLDSFFDYLNVQKRFFGFADLQLTSNRHGNELTVTTSITPAVDLSGDYRLVLVLTEDGVKGTTHAYDQVNNYADNAWGPMGGYESMPDPIPAANIAYDYVARTAIPSPDGEPGILPTSLTAGTTYVHPILTTLKPAWNISKLHAKILFIRHDDSTVLNSAEIGFPVEIENVNNYAIQAVLYPNPAYDHTTLQFDLVQAEDVSISVADLSGRIIYSAGSSTYDAGSHNVPLPVEQMANGIYIVNVATERGHTSLKLEVLH